MNKLVLCTNWLHEQYNRERGAGLAEYALLLFVVAVLSASVITAFGADIQSIFTEATDTLPNDVPAP